MAKLKPESALRPIQPFPAPAPPDRFDSWKEIAAYFKRDIRTLQRWEKAEGLPVRRLSHGKGGTVYAYRADLDAWWNQRCLQIPAEAEIPPATLFTRWRSVALASALAIALAVAGGAIYSARANHGAAVPPGIAGRLLANTTSEGRAPRLIPVGATPERMAITPDGTELYVTNAAANTVTVIRTSDDAVVATIPVGRRPGAIAIAPDGSRVYVGNDLGGISVIDTRTKIVSTLPTEDSLSDMALDPRSGKLYLALQFNGLKSLELSGGRRQTIPTVVAPSFLAIGAHRLYVNYQAGGPGGRSGHDAIDSLDLSTGLFVGGITGPPNVGGPLALSPDGTQLWASGLNACSSNAYDHAGCPVVPGGVVNVIRTSDGRVLRTLGFPDPAETISFFPDGSRVVIGGRNLKVIDASTFGVVESLSTPGGGNIVFTPGASRAYYLLQSQNRVAALDLSPRSCLAPPPGLVFWWPGDGTPNDIRHLSNAMLDSVTFAPGKVGQAFRFDGAGAASVGSVCDIAGGNSITDLTVGAWVKFDPDSPSDPAGREMPILARMSQRKGAPELWRLVRTASHRIAFCAGDCAPGSTATVASRSEVPSGQWWHVAATLGRSRLALYLNGRLEAESAAKPSDEIGCELRMGSSPLRDAAMRGLIDEVQWFNRALAPSEIKSIFSAGSAGLCYGNPESR